jgi:ATP-binding cassette subfamily F protein uup
LLLVSHDRAFLDSIATQSLVAEGDGRWCEYVGGYSDWVAQRPAIAVEASVPKAAPPARRTVRSKLSFKEQRELDALPAEIETLEREQFELQTRMSASDYHKSVPQQMKQDAARHDAIEAALMGKLERWSVLEEKAKAAIGASG